MIIFHSREVPKLVTVWLEVGVVFGVSVPTDVAHPHVEPSVRQDEAKALIGKVSYPVGARAEQTVLKKEDWAWSLSGGG